MNLVEQRQKMVNQLTEVKKQVNDLEEQLEQAQDNMQRHIGAIQMLDMLMQEQTQKAQDEKSKTVEVENVEA